jgi:hypothetical protein
MKTYITAILLMLAMFCEGTASDFFGIPTAPATSDPVPKTSPVNPVNSATPAPAVESGPIRPTVGLAQAAVTDSFSGIPWGSPIVQARQSMEAREGISLTEKQQNRLTYKGGTFAGRPIQVWGLDFAQNRLYRGAVIMAEQGEVRVQYQEVKNLLCEKYGRNMTERTEGTAVITEWKLASTPLSRDQKILKCAIVKVDDRPRVKLVYINETIKASVGAQ